MRLLTALVVLMTTLDVMAEVADKSGHWELVTTLSGDPVTETDLLTRNVRDSGVMEYIQRASRELDRCVPFPGEMQEFIVDVPTGEYLVDVPGIRFVERVLSVYDTTDSQQGYPLQKCDYRSIAWPYGDWWPWGYIWPYVQSVISTGRPRHWSRFWPQHHAPTTAIRYTSQFWSDISYTGTINSICFDRDTLYASFYSVTSPGTHHVKGWDSAGTLVFDYEVDNCSNCMFHAHNGRRYVLAAIEVAGARDLKVINIDNATSYVVDTEAVAGHLAPVDIIVGDDQVYCTTYDTAAGTKTAHALPLDLSASIDLDVDRFPAGIGLNSSYLYFTANAPSTNVVTRIPLADFDTSEIMSVAVPPVAVGYRMVGADDSYLYFRYYDGDGLYGLFLCNLDGTLAAVSAVTPSATRWPYQMQAPYVPVFISGGGGIGVDRIDIVKSQLQMSNAFIIGPAPDRSTKLIFQGGFFSKVPTAPEDVTWWMENEPDIFIEQCLAEIENVFHRNTTGYADRMAILKPKKDAVKRRVLREEAAGEDEFATRMGV